MSENTWPEQEAVLSWFAKYKIIASYDAANELIVDVTTPRLAVQEELSRAMKLVEAAKRWGNNGTPITDGDEELLAAIDEYLSSQPGGQNEQG